MVGCAFVYIERHGYYCRGDLKAIHVTWYPVTILDSKESIWRQMLSEVLLETSI